MRIYLGSNALGVSISSHQRGSDMPFDVHSDATGFQLGGVDFHFKSGADVIKTLVSILAEVVMSQKEAEDDERRPGS